MPTITEIAPQKKKANRFNVFIDGKFAFGVSAQTLLEDNLKSGKVLDDKQISKIISGEQLAKLTDIAINFLSYRPRSEKEVIEHLTYKIAQRENVKYSEAHESPLIGEVIKKLKKYKYINDLEFAKWYFESRSGSRPRGAVLIKLELRKKGIPDSIIETLLKNSQSELDLATGALGKKIKRWHKLSQVDLKKKVYQYLAMRGFDFETIKEAFAKIAEKR